MKVELLKYVLLFMLLCMSHSVVYADTMQIIYDGETHFYNNEPITLYIDDNITPTTVMPPIQFNGAVVVPAREVFSAMGAKVDWKSSEKKVYIEQVLDNDELGLIVLEMNSYEAWVNGDIQKLNMPAKLINNKVMVPIRFISEALGYTVNWSQSEKAIYIDTGVYKENEDNQEEEADEIEDSMNHEDYDEGNGNETHEDIIDSKVELWTNTEYIYYLDQIESLALCNIEGLDVEYITVDENYHTKELVIHLKGDYTDYLQEGIWNMPTGEIRNLKISHDNMETKISLMTHATKTIEIECLEGQIDLKLVNPSEKYAKVIVIDAGHGSQDPGTMYNGIKEKDLTLSISNALLVKLESDDMFKVYATREDDSFLELMERTELSNQLNADLFISIHINSVDNIPTASGTETYYTEKLDARNKIFAGIVQQALVNEFGTKDRGVKSDTYVVTKYTNAPAILIEIGFLTNESDRAMMLAPNFTERYANTIYQCILEYYAGGYGN